MQFRQVGLPIPLIFVPMAKFRSNYSRTSGAGRFRLLIWIIVMVGVLLVMFFMLGQLMEGMD